MSSAHSENAMDAFPDQSHGKAPPRAARADRTSPSHVSHASDASDGRSRDTSAQPGTAPDARVLVVAPQPFYDDRGTPIAVRQLVEGLSELGYGVDVLTFPVGRDVDIPRVRIIRAANPLRIRRVSVNFSLAKLALDVSLTRALAALVRHERYACIHAVQEAAFPAVWLGRRHGVPVIYDMQSSLPEQLAEHAIFRLPPVRGVLAACERWLLRRADAVVPFAGLAPQVRARAPGARVRELRSLSHAASGVGAADTAELRAELGIAPGAPVVLYSGTFEPYQGLPALIDAVPDVLEAVPKTVFVLVGGESGRGARWAHDARLERRAAAYIESGAVRLVRRQPRERMAAYLAMADVLVSPRAGGGNLPLKILDYLASDRPIVATDIPTHRTVLTPERALLVSPEPAAFSRAIVELLRDPARGAALAAAARTYAEETLGRGAFLASLRTLYDEVARRPAAAPGAPPA
ncbi:MAG: glycosyltransferase [Gemmatimonadaceae bacterium]